MRLLRDVVEEWLAKREQSEDCYCGDEPCWFHLSPAQQLEERVRSFRQHLEEEGETL